MKLLSYKLFFEGMKIKNLPTSPDSTFLEIYQKLMFITRNDNIEPSIEKLKSILIKISNELGYYDGTLKFLGCGEFGAAFSIGDKVIKITTDTTEASLAKKMTKVVTNHLINYYSVNSLDINGKKLYIIVMDKIKSSESKMIDKKSLEDILDPIISDISSNLKNLNSLKPNKEINKQNLNIDKKTFDNLYNQVIEIYKELYKYEIKESDTHSGNIGYINDEDGIRLVHYDIRDFGVVKHLGKIKDININ